MFNLSLTFHRVLAVVALCVALVSMTMFVAGCEAPFGASTPKPFRDYGYKPPTDQYNGTLFKLSQNYPTQKPDASKLPAFFKTDFQKDWRTYMLQVRDYCFQGNTAVDWRVEDNKVRGWYHMPWQDYGPSGREGIHGLTKEAPLAAGQLAVTHTFTDAVAYAVGFYNDFGGYAIGQVWKDHQKPDPSVLSNDGFPNGTVVCKTLFVDMPPNLVAAQIPFLANPIQWQAYTTNGFASCLKDSGPCVRSVKPVALIQMDIMIRDVRAPYGWILGTFQYNGALKNANSWNNLAPVGLMWGNDPAYTKNIPLLGSDGNFPPNPPAAKTPINADLKETIINPDASELPATHLGWDGRLNGPVDNPRSSCMSCHMTSSYPGKPLSPLFLAATDRPKSGTPEWNAWWLKWFQNVGWKDGKLQKFDQAMDSLDFSLQMSAAISNFYLSEEAPVRATPVHPVQRNAP